jgi:hypothetical protein
VIFDSAGKVVRAEAFEGRHGSVSDLDATQRKEALKAAKEGVDVSPKQ